MTRIIGIHGKPRAGKDTVANYLIEKYNYLRYGPSIRVKLTTAAMFDVPVEYLNDDKMKEAFDPFWQMTHREMMQKVGKECSRDIFGEDFWMRHVERFADKLAEQHTGIVLSDIRYANETKWVHEHGGDVIFVKRNSRGYVSNEQHAAERGLPDELADFIVENNGTLDELYAQVDAIVGCLEANIRV